MDKVTMFVIEMVILMIAITIHEFAHAKIADMSGDPTPRSQGRVTLNPLSHLDPMGTLFMAITAWSGYGIGWGRPVMTQPHRMKNPRWDSMFVALAGPVSNFLQAAIFALVLRFMGAGGTMDSLGSAGSIVATFLLLGLFINLALCFFNLLPFGPLDGHWILGAFLPEPARTKWFQFNRGPGAILFLVVVLLPPPYNFLGQIYGPVVDYFAGFMLGIKRG